jgi:hypothetical protein
MFGRPKRFSLQGAHSRHMQLIETGLVPSLFTGGDFPLHPTAALFSQSAHLPAATDYLLLLTAATKCVLVLFDPL